MKDIVLSLVFAAPLLIIMLYPAMKIANKLSRKFELNEKFTTKLTIIITIGLSILFGTLLHFT